MKRFFLILILTLFITSAGVRSSPVHALLMSTAIDGSFVVVDDVNSVQWADLNRFAGLNFNEVLSEIDFMNTSSFAGASDWHLASFTELAHLFDEIQTVGDARQFEPTLGSPSVTYLYLGRYDQVDFESTHAGASWAHGNALPDGSTAIMQNLDVGNYADAYAVEDFGAFVLSIATAGTPVPEPATLLLMGIGLIGIAGSKRYRNVKTK